MSVKAILVADDEKHLRRALFTALTRLGHAVELAETGPEAVSKFQSQRFDLVITDMRMTGLDGLGVLKAVKALAPAIPVIIMTSYGSVEVAVEAMREGAHDFILKPFPAGVIEDAVNRALSQAEPVASESQLTKGSGGVVKNSDRPIITRNHKMSRLMDLARSVAASPSTVLLQGESGTGKELLARFIHQSSPRANAPFVAINCASLPESLLESELFGHEKGAFTGAVGKKIGKFEMADGGTILLDEISEMDMALQAKLLRVLQEGEIDRVGGKEPQKIDVRVVATTNRNLKQWVDSGNFRADLYYRLNVIPFYIPALRERLDDVPLLADYFREKYAALNNKKVDGLSALAVEALGAYSWPGNIRELENTLARGVLLAVGGVIEPHDMFMDEDSFMTALERSVAPPVASFGVSSIAGEVVAGPMASPAAGQVDLDNEALGASGLAEVPFAANNMVANNVGDSPAANSSAPADTTLSGWGINQATSSLMTIGEMERNLIGQVLSETDGNRTHAAKILGISVRTLRNKLAEYRGEGVSASADANAVAAAADVAASASDSMSI